jgi:hypothetical protein
VSPAAAGAAAEQAMAPYEAILEHAELELELAGAGRVDRLMDLAERWASLTAHLPDVPSAAAGPLLERAQLIHERTRIELMRMRESVLADVAATSRGRRAATGYAGQLARRPRLDRSA